MATRRRLKSMADVRRFLAFIICQTEKKKIDLQLGSKLAYMCSILIKTIEQCDLENRIDGLEKKIGG